MFLHFFVGVVDAIDPSQGHARVEGRLAPSPGVPDPFLDYPVQGGVLAQPVE